MEAFRAETMVHNGRVVIDNLPFDDGEVEVIVLDRNTKKLKNGENPLKGSVLRYDDPFGPACPPEDWEVLR